MNYTADDLRLSLEQTTRAIEAKIARAADVDKQKRAKTKIQAVQSERKERQSRMEIVPLNTDRLEKLGLKLKCVPLLIIAYLEKRWWSRFQHNPLKLPAFEINGIRISGHVKARGLAALEKSGLVLVEHRTSKSPCVTLNWRKVTTPEVEE
jgi:hypothetical protein